MAKKRNAGNRRKNAKPSDRSGKRRSTNGGTSKPFDVDPAVLREFFEAAAEFADAESRLVDTGAFRLDMPAMGVNGVMAGRVDLGSAGTGFLVLPTLQHYRALAAAGNARLHDHSDILVLFVSLAEVPKAMRRQLEELGWTQSGDGRFPLLTKRGAGGEEIAATTEDFRVAALAAAAMAHVSRSGGSSLHARDEAFQCTLVLPGVGEVDVLHPGDLDEDELGSIVEEGIEATVLFPEAALAAALDVEFLSPKAREVLARARPSAPGAGVELRARLDELAHVGDLLKATSRSPGRPAILGELGAHLLEASRGPDSLAVVLPRGDRPNRRRPGAAAPRSRRRSRETPSSGDEPGRRLYRLKITLRGIRPPIWRRIEVSSDIPLARLHSAIQEAMGWEDEHLHEFEHDGERYGRPDDAFEAIGDRVWSEKTTRLEALLGKPEDSLVYRYDFGDGWEHDVVLEQIDPLPPGQRAPRPRRIDGRRACPPEDCGGPWGYARMLEALANPRDPEHAMYREWVDGGFDPEAF